MNQKDWEWGIAYQIFKTQILVNILTEPELLTKLFPLFFFNSVIYKGGCGVP